MCMLDEIRAKRDEIYAIARRHKAEKLWVFGSCARREAVETFDRKSNVPDRKNQLQIALCSQGVHGEGPLHACDHPQKSQSSRGDVRYNRDVCEGAWTERELVELHNEKDHKRQAEKMHHFGESLADIVMPDLDTVETESSLELNFFIGKIKHTVRRIKRQ